LRAIKRKKHLFLLAALPACLSNKKIKQREDYNKNRHLPIAALQSDFAEFYAARIMSYEYGMAAKGNKQNDSG
jgi:hypothetical protein